MRLSASFKGTFLDIICLLVGTIMAYRGVEEFFRYDFDPIHMVLGLALGAGAPAEPVVTEVLAALADDLDAPRAVAAVDAWVDATLGTHGLADTSDPDAAVRVHALLDAALGLSL